MNKGELYQIELQGEMEKIHNARTAAESVGRQVVQAPMPGVILKTYVKKGDLVKRGDPLCVLVAMKMENEIRSVTDGVVKEVFVEDGMKVGLNDRIMVIEKFFEKNGVNTCFYSKKYLLLADKYVFTPLHYEYRTKRRSIIRTVRST